VDTGTRQVEGQTSFTDLLDQPVGTEPIQMALPITSSSRPARSVA
jgi:hypothetical protein